MLRGIFTLIITILVIKFIPNIYANLIQDLILIPFYFYEVIIWYKETLKEVSFKNNYKIVNKRREVTSLEEKINKLQEKGRKNNEKLKIIRKNLDIVIKEEERHIKYINNLKEILENYYLENLKSYLGEDLIKRINYPSQELKLKRF